MNDIAFILPTLRSELSQLGVDSSVVGRIAADPGLQRTSFVGQSIRSCVQVWRSDPHDILHINYGAFSPIAFADPPHPMVLHLHGSDIRPASTLKGRLANAISRFGCSLAAAVWYSTPDLGRVLDAYGIRSSYMPNPVDEAFFADSTTKESKPHVLFATPLSVVKGADVALEAMSSLARDCPDLKISAFAFGPDPVEALAYRKRLPSSVLQLPWVPHSQMQRIFSDATVVVGQQHLGVLGLVELEAMACGKPVVVHLDPALYGQGSYYREKPPVLGSGSGHEIVESVLSVANDAGRASEVGLATRRWVKTYHSCRVVARLLLDQYCSILGLRGDSFGVG